MARPAGIEINEFALADFREVRGFSKSELAKRAEISLSHYSEIERGISTPSREAVHRLAAALVIDPLSIQRLGRRATELQRTGT